MPIEGATAPEEGGKGDEGSELGELEGSAGSWSYPDHPPLITLHLWSMALYVHIRGGLRHRQIPDEEQTGGSHGLN